MRDQGEVCLTFFYNELLLHLPTSMDQVMSIKGMGETDLQSDYN